ncbi:MAG TPA: LPXTG cell wall anchor domain-containing protein, partial [Candidatus Enterococcus avicola]|nr:LPXTG cell wall anchor domain-containing protein [Candidatus Enterococcus avicola]
GDYNLIETKAPTGYILESSDIAFTIVKDQYGNAAHIQTVNNLRQGLLPSTGGTGIYAFLIIGSMMMAGAYFWFKRSKEHAEV